eukprot:TRINITY_DN7225_c0_g1_i1.p1 TRINITY_DN7225_c0_g1~~TRINITY_DN7225_c0_g1_i1.p1  ORF type:complete len:686 (+),score=292.61 TRINITY_DN7225_c0_g1_i1:46-2058(+)
MKNVAELQKLQQFFGKGEGEISMIDPVNVSGDSSVLSAGVLESEIPDSYGQHTVEHTMVSSRERDCNNTLEVVKRSLKVPDDKYDVYLENVLRSIPPSMPLHEVMSHLEVEIDREQDSMVKRKEVSQAVKQKAAFLRSRAELLESETALRRAHASFKQECEKRFQEIAMKERKASQSMASFSKSVCDFLPEYTTAQMMRDAGLDLSPSNMRDIVSKVLPDPSTARNILDTLLTSKVPESHKAEMREDLLNCGVSETLAEVVFRLHEHLNSEMFEAATTIDSLKVSADTLYALQKKVANIEEACQHAKEEGDLRTTEILQDQALITMEDTLAVIRDRLKLLVGSGQDSLTPDVQEANLVCQEELARNKERCDDIDNLLEEDARKLVDTHSRLSQVRMKEKEESDDALKRYDLELDETEKAQRQVEEQILELQRQYKDLAERRWHIVNKRIEVFEASDAKQRYFEAQCKTQQTHLQQMQEVKDYLTVITQLHRLVDRWVATASGGISTKMGMVETELRGHRLDEQKQHYHIFRKYYLANGEQIFKKEERVKECNRLIRHHKSTAHHESVLDLCDDQSQMYLNHAKELERMRDECLGKVRALQEKSEQAARDFGSSAKALREADIKFTDPHDELLTQTAKLKQLSVTHRMKLFEADAKENEEEQIELQKMFSK